MLKTSNIKSMAQILRDMKNPPVEEETVEQMDEALDPVNKVATKKKFKDRKDKDIDNDGDVDSSDKYLHKRRKAISKAMKEMAEEIEGLDERRRDYSNLIPFPDKVLTDFAKRAKKAGLDFDQYTKFVKGTFKDGADEGRAIIKGREIFKDKEDGRKKLSGAEAKRDNIARRAALRKRLGIEQTEQEKQQQDPRHDQSPFPPKKKEIEEKMHKGIRLTPELFKNVKKFGVELEKYAKKSGGIDKDDFMKVAAIAKKGMLPDKSDIPSDTDPRDKVLSMMAGIVGDEILLAFKGLSPSIDNYIKKTMKEDTELDEDKKYHYYNLDRGVYRLQKDNNGKIIGKMHDRQKEMRAGFPNADEVLSNTKQAAVKVAKLNKMNEDTELDEKKGSDYELYHKTFSGAMQHAYAVAKKRGYTVDKNDIDNKVASGPRKPSSGKTNRYILGTDKKQNLHVQVANLDNKRFELNMYIESVQEDEDLEKIAKELAGASKMHMGQSKRIKKHLDKMKKEEVELTEAPSPNQAAIDRFMKGGGKITKIEPGTGKQGAKQVAGFKKTFDRAMKKQREIEKGDAKRRYVKGGGKSGEYSMPDYNIVKNINKFPRSLASGLQKMISGVRISNYMIPKTKVPGMGITFPGDSAPKLMIEYRERMFDPGLGKIGADPKFSEPGVDTKTYRKFEMIVYINEAATAKDRKSDRVDWFQRKEFEGKTADEVAKRTLQYLKTKVKRMANEEVEEAVKYDERKMKKLARKDGMIAKMMKTASAKSVFNSEVLGDSEMERKYQKEELVTEREMTDNEMKKREEIVMKLKKKMPEFVKRYGDKAKEVMYATATKMAMGEELEPLETKKSKKKDKINLKPEMDENMRTLKDFRNRIQEHCGECGAMDHIDEAKPEFEVKYASSKKGPIKVSKFMSMEDAKKFLAQVKKEGMNGIISKGGKPIKASHMMMKGKMNASYHKDKMNASYHKEENEVKEAVTDMGVEYGEQDWDLGARLDNSYPNLDTNFTKYMEEDLEGPYMFENETYFFDRKMGSWFSASGEDYVDEDMNKTLSYNFVKAELVRQ